MKRTKRRRTAIIPYDGKSVKHVLSIPAEWKILGVGYNAKNDCLVFKVSGHTVPTDGGKNAVLHATVHYEDDCPVGITYRQA